MTGNLLLKVEGNENRIVGCTDLDAERKFSIPLGTRTDQLYFVNRRLPVVLDTDNSFLVNARNELIRWTGQTHDLLEIIIYRDIRINTIEGWTEEETYTELLEPPNPTYIGNEVQYFPVETTNELTICRL